MMLNKILQNTSKYLKLGGIIVYSTCSIEREENNDVINNFLKNNRNFSIIKINLVFHNIMTKMVNHQKEQ